MTKRAMVIDYKYCTGCGSCEVSCRKEKGLDLDVWGISVQEIGPAKFPDGTWEWDYVPVPSSLCDLCEDRLQEGKVPLCQLHCLSAVINVVPVEEVSDLLAKAQHGKVSVYLP